MRPSAFFSPLLVSCALLSGCGGNVKETLGIARKAPDEFRVVSRPPLSVPPEFNLRPPAEGGDASGRITDATEEAQGLVFGQSGATNTNLRSGSADTAVIPVQASDALTTADSNFLNRAGAAQADSSVRAQLRAERGADTEEDKGFLEKLREPANNEPMVNANAEAERLKENKEEGKPVTEGETPTVKPRDRGVLDKIF